MLLNVEEPCADVCPQLAQSSKRDGKQELAIEGTFISYIVHK